MSPRAAHLALLILSASVSILLALRSRSRPALRAAAVACWVFVGLDVGRWLWGPLVEAGVWPWSWIDVFAFAAMPGLWGALLPGAQHLQQPLQQGPEPAKTPGKALVHNTCSKPVLPLLACLLYAAALLALRHHPGVAERWEAWLAAPRLCVGAMALWVVLRWRSAVVPGVEPPDERLGGERKNLGSEEGVNAHAPGVGDGDGHVGGKVVPFGERTAAGKEGASLGGVGAARGQPGPEGLDREGVVGSHARHGGAPPPLAQPSRLIGVVMGLGCAACVVGGLWADWHAVQALAALAWLLTAIVAWKA